MTKSFKLRAAEIQQLIPSMGGCVATDKITVEGNRVVRMAREEPGNAADSGWIFYGGGETQEFLDDPANAGIYDLNTIANYDPEIIQFLTYPPGTEIERGPNGKLKVISPEASAPDVVLMYPVGPGSVRLTKQWSLAVSETMFRRIEDESLVLWRDGITIWIACYGPTEEPIRTRLDRMVADRSADSFDYECVESPTFTRCRYWLNEQSADARSQSSAYVFAFSAEHTMHAAIYFDHDSLRTEVDLIWSSVECALHQQSSGS